MVLPETSKLDSELNVVVFGALHSILRVLKKQELNKLPNFTAVDQLIMLSV